MLKIKSNRKTAFTLAETLITVVILGIVVAILVPSLIKNQVENANRTKVKKAMASYEKAINYVIIENDIRSTEQIREFSENDGCEYVSGYFKKVQKYGENNCIFKTPDRVWWNISDLSNPIIILKDELKVKNHDELRALAKDFDDKNVFALVGRFDDLGTLRVDDNGFEQSQENNDDNKLYMTKLWGFINNQKLEPAACDDYICKFKQGAYDTFCASNNARDKYNCQYCKLDNSVNFNFRKCDVYDENGVRIAKIDMCNDEYKNCKSTTIYREDGVSVLSTKVGCDVNGENCLYKLGNVVSSECSYPIDQSCANKADCHGSVCDVYNENGIRTKKLDNCWGTPTIYDNCQTIISYKNNGTTKTQKKSGCTVSTGICSKIEEYADNGTTVIRTKTNCDKNGNCESCEGTGCP